MPKIEISKGVVEISLINTKKEYIKEIYHNVSIDIINNKIEKASFNEICQNDSISLINNKIKEKIFESQLLNEDNIIEILIKNEKNKPKNKCELISEKQINTNIEIKGIEKEKFKNYIIDKQNYEINIKKQNKFGKELISINNEIIISINHEEKKEKNLKKEILSKENIIEFIIENNTKSKTNNNLVNKDEKYTIYENERFSLDDNDKNILIKNKNEKCDFIEEKRDNISFKEITEDKNKKRYIEFIISNNENLLIEKVSKTNDKIIEEKMKLNEDTTNKNKNIVDNYANVNIKNEELSYVQGRNNENRKINYNINNEIDKCDGLEINPYELNRTKNNENNIYISYENKIEVLNNKNSIFKEKAKKNMMKIILPIRLKTTLRDYIHRNILPILINKLKKIAFASRMNKTIEKDTEKEDIEKNKNIEL